MPRASEVKRGDVVDINDVAYIVKEVEVRNPSARGAQTLYKFRFNNAQTRQKHEQTIARARAARGTAATTTED